MRLIFLWAYGLPLDTFVLPLWVTAVGADAALLCCAAGTVLNAANYAPSAIKISTKLTAKGMVADPDPHEFRKLDRSALKSKF
jgi:hypothetical protein